VTEPDVREAVYPLGLRHASIIASEDHDFVPEAHESICQVSIECSGASESCLRQELKRYETDTHEVLMRKSLDIVYGRIGFYLQPHTTMNA